MSLNKIKRVFGDTADKEDIRDKSISDSKLHRDQFIATDIARKVFGRTGRSNYNVDDEDNFIDPYSKTSSVSDSENIAESMTMANDHYQTSLLEKMVKNQNNTSLNKSTLMFQEKTLEYLDKIANAVVGGHNKLDAGSATISEEFNDLNKSVGDLAKSLAELDVQKASRHVLKHTASGRKVSSAMDMFGLVTDMVGFSDDSIFNLKKSGSMIKKFIQNQIINATGYGFEINKFRNDPAVFFQDIINRLAISKNKTVADLFRPHAKGTSYNKSDKKYDPSEAAKFDQRVYQSITRVIPDQLYKMSAFMEYMATGKTPTLMEFDHEKRDYVSLVDRVKKEIDSGASVTKSTNQLSDELISLIATMKINGNSLADKHIKLDENGNPVYKDGKYILENQESIKSMIGKIVNSKAGFQELASDNISIDEYMRLHGLDSKLVNGRYVRLSDEDILKNRNSLKAIQEILLNSSKIDVEEMEKSLLQNKEAIQNNKQMYSNAWGNSILSTVYRVASGVSSPDELNNIFGSNPFFGSGIVNSAADVQSNPTTPKNESGVKRWEDMTVNERKAAYNKYINDNALGNKSINKIQRSYQGMENTDSFELTIMKTLLHEGLIEKTDLDRYLEDKEFTHYKKIYDNYIQALELYRRMDILGLTSDNISFKGNYSKSDLSGLGYINSYKDILDSIDSNGKLNNNILNNNPLFTENIINKVNDDKYFANLHNITSGSFNGSMNDNIFDSFGDIMSGIISDPKISKQAGLVAGGAAGMGIAKLLKMSGVVKSPYAGYLLGSVGAALMMTERAQSSLANIFGPEGNIANKDGVTNRQIFMSKLVTKWLPQIGAGSLVGTKMMKFFNTMGPMGTILGIPASLLSGLTAAYIAPKIIDKLKVSMFGEEAKQKGTLLSKIGSFFEDNPYVKRFLGVVNKPTKPIDIHLATLRSLDNTNKMELDQINSKLENTTDPVELESLTKRKKELEKDSQLISDAIREIHTVNRSNDATLDKEKEVDSIVSNLSKKISSKTEHMRSVKHQNYVDNATEGSVSTPTSDMKFTSTVDRAAETLKTAEFEDENVKSRIERIVNTGSIESSFDDLFSDNNTEYDEKMKQKLSDTSVFLSTYKIDDLKHQLSQANNKEEFDQILNDFMSVYSDGEDNPLKYYIERKKNAADKRKLVLNELKDVYRKIYPDMDDINLNNLALMTAERIIQRNTSLTPDNMFDRMKSKMFGANDKYKDMDNLYNTLNQFSMFTDSGSGTYKLNTEMKMSDLSDIKFKNNIGLDKAGCSIASFNNALLYLGVSQVEPEVLRDIANKHLTYDGGVTSNFFIEAASRLGLSVKIYNNRDNKFTESNISKLNTNKNVYIALLENVGMSSGHFVTIKSKNNKNFIINDPEAKGLTDISVSTLVSRLVEVVEISKNETTSDLVQSDESIQYSKTLDNIISKIRDNKIVKRLTSTINKSKDIISFVKNNDISTIAKDIVKKGVHTFNPYNTDVKQIESSDNILTKIYNKISDFYNKPLPVSIWSDATLALSSGDENVSRTLNTLSINDTTDRNEIRNANRIRSIRSQGALRKERKDQQLVQDAIINQEGLRAGTSTGKGGKGTERNGRVEATEDGFLKRIGGTAAKVLGLGALLVSTYGTKKMFDFLGGHNVKPTVNGIKGLFSDETENTLDENGYVTEGGSYKDVSGVVRNIRILKNTAKFSIKTMTGLGLGMIDGGQKVATKLGSFGGKLALKEGAGPITKFIGKTIGVTADAMKMVNLPNSIFAKLIKALREKVLWVLDNCTAVQKIPGIGRYFAEIMETIGMFAWRFISKFEKILPKFIKEYAARKGIKAAVTKIPLVGLGIAVTQAIFALINGFRVPDKVLLIPRETVTLKDRFLSAGVKFLWDALPSIITSAISVIPAFAPFMLGVDAVVAILQSLIGFDGFMNMLGLDDSWRKSRVDEYNAENGDALKIKYQEAEAKKQLEEEKLDELDKQKEKLAFDTSNKVTPDSTGSNLYSDNRTNVESYTSTNTNIGETGNSSIDKSHTEYKDPYKQLVNKTNTIKIDRETLENTPEVLAAKKEWENSDKDYFHPLGDDSTRITSVFGPRNIVGASKNHKGIDFSTGGKSGKPIMSMKSGKVITSNPNYGVLEVLHNDGTSARYLHLQDRFMNVGDSVSEGDVIGTSGGIGANGIKKYIPHLHMELRNKNGQIVDPFLEMGLDPANINVSPTANNRENISYLDKYSFLLDESSKAKSNMNVVKEESVDKKDVKNNKQTSIKTKDAGGPEKPIDEKKLDELRFKKDPSLNKLDVNINVNELISLMTMQMSEMKRTNDILSRVLEVVSEHFENNSNVLNRNNLASF